MSHRFLTILAVVMAFGLLATIDAAAQSVPKTSWGAPDLQGVVHMGVAIEDGKVLTEAAGRLPRHAQSSSWWLDSRMGWS